MSGGPDPTRQAIDLLRRQQLTIAVAESLTGGLLVAEFIRVPGASEVVRGGVVAYATDLKASLLGVDADLLSERGPVDPDVARQMALGARLRLGRRTAPASIGLSTTGVAGPGYQDGHPPGTVFIGLSTPSGSHSTAFVLSGDRNEVRSQTVRLAIGILLAELVLGEEKL